MQMNMQCFTSQVSTAWEGLLSRTEDAYTYAL